MWFLSTRTISFLSGQEDIKFLSLLVNFTLVFIHVSHIRDLGPLDPNLEPRWDILDTLEPFNELEGLEVKE